VLSQIKAHPFFASIDWGKLDRREIPPPWVPTVKDATDTRNIASEFLNEPAAVTPSPAYSRLRDMTGSTPPSFNDFTFTHQSVLDGTTYRVSFAEEDPDAAEEGLAIASVADRQQAFNQINNAAAGTTSTVPLTEPTPRNSSETESGAETSGDGSGLIMGQMEGLKM
jgi:hypothetical protein